MPDFVNPFSGKIPDRKLTMQELVRALRLDLAAEHEAVHIYLAHADATDNALAKAVLTDIADEERVHAGEFARLISILTVNEDELLAQGAAEVDAVAGKIAGSTGPAPAGGTARATIGSLKSGQE